MEGLYFYKLVSPYAEDVTKDCKLTVNEIDHNFLTLKNGIIKEVSVDNQNNHLVIKLNNGDMLKADLPVYTENVSAEYDKENGVITLHYDNTTKVIDGLFTTNNIKEYLDKYVKDYVLGRIEKEVVITDETLNGCGVQGMPLGLNVVEKTSFFKPVKKLIDLTEGENKLPYIESVKTGDRYLTLEYYKPHGYLYNYESAKKIANDCSNGWRIPSKSDWDGLLNAIELCDEDKNHDAITCNHMFGRVAGKLLKSKTEWRASSGNTCNDDCNCVCHTTNYVEVSEDEPKEKMCSTTGVDAYSMTILPSGYGDGCMALDYFKDRAKFWTNTSIQVTDVYTKRFDFDKGGVMQMADSPYSVCSLRLVKDYDGTNLEGIETIKGVPYKTVLMPSTTSDNGYAIWMASNIAFADEKYNPVEPNGGDYLSESKVYYINEWNGFEWVKRVMTDGDTLVIHDGPDGKIDNEYRMIEGELVNANLLIVNEVINKYDTAIADVNARIDIVDAKVEENIAAISKLNEDLANEIERSTSKDEEIQGRLLVGDECKLNIAEGTLLLATEDSNNNITIKFNSDYGTF